MCVEAHNARHCAEGFTDAFKASQPRRARGVWKLRWNRFKKYIYIFGELEWYSENFGLCFSFLLQNSYSLLPVSIRRPSPSHPSLSYFDAGVWIGKAESVNFIYRLLDDRNHKWLNALKLPHTGSLAFKFCRINLGYHVIGIATLKNLVFDAVWANFRKAYKLAYWIQYLISALLYNCYKGTFTFSTNSIILLVILAFLLYIVF